MNKPNLISTNSNRWLALDVLRGLSIFGMIFSAIVPKGVLPGWMYHVQNPPPTHHLNLTIPGISWVDWVFPIFIFCMGVAIPLACRKKAENMREFFYHLFIRFVMLWAFAYLVTILGSSGLTGKLNLVLFNVRVRGYELYIFVFLGFLALFALYWRAKPSSKRKWIRVAGVSVILGIIALFHWGYGAQINLHKRSIILLLLAFLYLFGSLIWYISRNSLWRRVTLFITVVAISFWSKESGFDQWLYGNKSLSWVFNMEEIYFLLILIPATWVGDYMSGNLGWRGQKSIITHSPPVGHLFYLFLGLLIGFLCFGLYQRWNELLIIVVSLSVLCLCLIICRNSSKALFPLITLAAALLLVGLLMDSYEGGIKKVPATFSYCFTMGGISILLLLFFHYLCRLFPGSFFVRIFSGAGANPLLSYVAFGSFVMPVLHLTFLVGLYNAAYPQGEPWLGVVRGFVIVLLTMYLVSILSKKGVFWRC